MRITENMRIATAQLSESRAAERMQSASTIASTGLRVNLPQDDPAAFSSITARMGRVATLTGRQQTSTRAAGDLDLAESTLANAVDMLSAAKDLAVQMADGSRAPTDRATAALSVTELRDELLRAANTQGSNGYLFGGTRTDVPPIDSTGAFVGNDNATHVEISDNVNAVTNASGAKAFTAAGGRDILGDLQAFATALTANDVPGIMTALGNMDLDHQQLAAARIDAGLHGERLRSAADVIGSNLLAVNGAQAAEAGADAPAAYSALIAAKDAYDRSLSVTKQILSLTSMGG